METLTRVSIGPGADLERFSFWDYAFVTVAGIQFHPANSVRSLDVRDVLVFCCEVADMMCELREERCR